jgi:hypothetical protein
MKIREVIKLLEKFENEYGSEIEVTCFDLEEMKQFNIDNITFDVDFGYCAYIEMYPYENEDDD